MTCSNHIYDCAGGGDGCGGPEFEERVGAVGEDEDESGHGEQGRQGVERNFEGAGQVGLADAQPDYACLLEQELEQDADDDEEGYNFLEREEAEEGSDQAEGYEGAMGDSVAWVQ